jgi:hypothetical protein
VNVNVNLIWHEKHTDLSYAARSKMKNVRRKRKMRKNIRRRRKSVNVWELEKILILKLKSFNMLSDISVNLKKSKNNFFKFLS